MDTSTETQDAARLPLWRNCLEEMIETGVDHGSVYPVTYFESHLRAKRDSLAFNLGVSEIRKALEPRGLYLTGRGTGSTDLVIVPAAENLPQARSHARQAMSFLKRSFVLLTATRLELLSDEQRAKHERETEKAAKRMALLGRRVPSLPPPSH